MLPISLHKTDFVVSNWCFLAFFIFFPMLTLGSKDSLGAAGPEAAVARLNSACHLVRRRVGAEAEAISMSFTGKELWHFRWKLRKNVSDGLPLVSAEVQLTRLNLILSWHSCSGLQSFSFARKYTELVSDFLVWLSSHTDATCLLWFLKPEMQTPKMQKTKADIHNESKVLTEHLKVHRLITLKEILKWSF